MKMLYEAKDKLPVKVYLDHINYTGEVNDSTLVAQFRSMGWAKDFIKEAKKSVEEMGDDESYNNFYRIRVEEG